MRIAGAFITMRGDVADAFGKRFDKINDEVPAVQSKRFSAAT
jgi:hypothetical protein